MLCQLMTYSDDVDDDDDDDVDLIQQLHNDHDMEAKRGACLRCQLNKVKVNNGQSYLHLLKSNVGLAAIYDANLGWGF